MIASTVDNITPIKNKKDSNNDNINLLRESLKSLRTKTFNVYIKTIFTYLLKILNNDIKRTKKLKLFIHFIIN